jgi:hypothetical protein
MNNKYPKTLAAAREIIREETDGHPASDSANWALGDALIEECGCDPIWDRDEPPYLTSEFKGGLKLREATDYLIEHGIDEFTVANHWILLMHRDASELFPPDRRHMNATWTAHWAEHKGPDDMDEFMKKFPLPPGEVLVFGPEDSEAYHKYGPA